MLTSVSLYAYFSLVQICENTKEYLRICIGTNPAKCVGQLHVWGMGTGEGLEKTENKHLSPEEMDAGINSRRD